MRRLLRYPLSAMVWISVWVGWSTVLGLVVAAVTGERLEPGDRVSGAVSPAVSMLFTVLLPLGPTLAALWFNDWARDGFPTREERRRAALAARPPATAADAEPGAEADATATPQVAPEAPLAPELLPEVEVAPPEAALAVPAEVAPEVAVPAETEPGAGPDAPRREVPAGVLGVPIATTQPGSAAGAAERYPVAPLLRDTPPAATAAARGAEPIDLPGSVELDGVRD